MATTTDKLQRLATGWAVPDDPTVIVDFIKEAGVLQTALVANASHGISHKYKVINALPAGAFRNIGEGIAPVSLGKDNMKIDLWNLSLLIQEDFKEFENYPNGVAGWLNDNLPAYIAGMGQRAAAQIFYGTLGDFSGTAGAWAANTSGKGFVGLHQYAKAYSNVQQLSGASASSTSIFAVRWDAQNGASLRVNGGGELIRTMQLHTDGKPLTVVTDTTNNYQLPVYSWLLDAYMTLVVPSAKSVSAITQIDATHKPTVTNMNQLVTDIYASSGEKVIYCNLTGWNYINELKGSKLSMYTDGANYDDALGYWRGVPIVIDENIASVETSAID